MRCSAFLGENKNHAIFGGQGCYFVHPSDTATALVALNASLEIVGPSGTSTVRAEDFFILPQDDIHRENILKPTEIVSRIFVPKQPDNTFQFFYKIRQRQSWDFAVASIAAVLEREGTRVSKASLVLGGVAPKPWRVVEAEKAAQGQPVNMTTAEHVGDAALIGARPLRDNRYKLDLVRNLIRMTYEACI